MKSPVKCLAIFLLFQYSSSSSSLESTKRSRNNNCGDEIIRCVNLGGWLLWEPWIVPTIFEEVNVGNLENKIVDEWTYALYIDPEISKENHER